ncbi:MAG: RsmE family RNA methyltransferase [Saprospiraceae bacterium]|nr:RsmE family RNA methyltransferase [Saprospiraceae bacterium]
MELFYADNITSDKAYFSKDETRHISKTYRKRVGDTIEFTLGDGKLYAGVIRDISKNGLIAEIKEMTDYVKPWKGRLHMAVAPTKNFNRIEWIVERMVELGLDELTPIISHRSERKKWKSNRLDRIIRAAAKQSLKCVLPIVHEPVPFESFCTSLDPETTKYFGHCEDGEKTPLKEINFQDKNVCFAIGPEGDFTKEEIDLACSSGFRAVSLGQQRLRTETAAMKMAVAFHIYNDWEK